MDASTALRGELEPFVYTFVEYVSGSAFQKLLALISLSPIFVMVSYATLLVSRRDLHTLTLLCGQLVNEAVNTALKHALGVARPFPALHAAFNAASPYAMPSDHAQFVFFLAAYVALWSSRRWLVGAAWRLALVSVAFAWACAVSVSRVVLRYHTVSQIVAGAVIGAVGGAAWFHFTERVLRPRFSGIANAPFARALLIRDCTHVNVIVEEYRAVARAEGAATRRDAHGSHSRGGARDADV